MNPTVPTAPAASDTVSLVDEAAACERAGEWEASYHLYQRVFWAALKRGDVSTAVDALRGESRAFQPLQRLEEAAEMADLSREIALRYGLLRAASRALNTLGALRYRQQDWDGARHHFLDALDMAVEVGDTASIVPLCQNLGVLANIQGDLSEARIRYLESISASIRSECPGSLAAAYNNLAMVCADLGEWTQSALYFHRAIEIAEQSEDAPLLASLHANLAEPLLCTGEFERAEASLAEAERLASCVGDDRVLVDIARFRGVSARLQGEHAAAERWLQRSVTLAEQHDTALERAEALEELARLRWDEHRKGAALALLREARAGYRSVAASGEVGRVDGLAAKWRGRAAAEAAAHVG